MDRKKFTSPSAHSVYLTRQTAQEFSGVLERPTPAVNKRSTYAKSDFDLTGKWEEESIGGIKTASAAVKLVRHGWAEGARKLGGLTRDLLALVPPATSTRRRATWEDDGDSLDPDRALAGQWDTAYRTTKKRETRGTQNITIIGQFGGNCGKTGDELYWNGATSLVLVDMLENAGYSVEYLGGNSAKHYTGETSVDLIELKGAGEQLRIDAAASILCHPGVFRSLFFRQIISLPFQVESGLGCPCSVSDVRAECADAVFDNAVVVGNAWTKNGAVAEIKRVLASLRDAAD